MPYASSLFIFAFIAYSSPYADISFDIKPLNGNEISASYIDQKITTKLTHKNPGQQKNIGHAFYPSLKVHHQHTDTDNNMALKADFQRSASICDFYSTPISLNEINFCIDSIPWQSTQPLPYMIIYDSKSELIMLQWKGLNEDDHDIRLTDMRSKTIMKTTLLTGSTIAYFDTQTLHQGSYYVEVFQNEKWIKNKITITK
jgi:hypothetical protein